MRLYDCTTVVELMWWLWLPQWGGGGTWSAASPGRHPLPARARPRMHHNDIVHAQHNIIKLGRIKQFKAWDA